MFQELSDILQDTVHPAIYSGMVSLSAALEKHQAVQYKERIIQLRMDANNREPITLADEAISIVYDQVRALTQQMKIELDLDILSMDKLSMILECLVFAPSDNDSEYLAALDAGEDSEETLQEVLAIYMQCDAVELMEYVTGCDGAVIVAIREVVEKNLSYLEKAEEGVQETVQLLNQHQVLVGEKLTVGMESLQSGTSVGASAEELVRQSQSRLAELPPEELADQLLSIAIMAKTPRDALQDEVMFFTENIIHDPFMVQKAYKRVNKRLTELPPENTP
ncbi:hypothetical protein D3C85_07230 [compost metagenome]|jgi:hypothetical protein